MKIRLNGKLIDDPWNSQVFEYFQVSMSELGAHSLALNNGTRIRSEHSMMFEWITTLKSNDLLTFYIQFDKRVLHMMAYPPDYNRGFDVCFVPLLSCAFFWFFLNILAQRFFFCIFFCFVLFCFVVFLFDLQVGNAIVRILNDSLKTLNYHGLYVWDNAKSGRVIYLPQLLVLLPYPDMSMVFNVIAFSSTLYAFFFGTAFNNVYRPVSHLHKRNIDFIAKKLKKKIKQLKNKLCAKEKAD